MTQDPSYEPDSAALKECLSSSRSKCDRCQRSRYLYCDKCLLVFDGSPIKDDWKVERVEELPTITILQHPGENSSKSSAGGLHIMSPNNVTIKTWHHSLESHEGAAKNSASSNFSIDDYSESDTVLLYPCEESKLVDDMNWESIQNVIVIDGTWFQSSTIMKKEPGLKKFPSVKLQGYSGNFWRHQNKSKENLSTAEAVYFLCREISKKKSTILPKNFDNILLLFEVIKQRVGNPDAKRAGSEKKRLIARDQQVENKTKKQKTTSA